jgi:hypothetical protein
MHLLRVKSGRKDAAYLGVGCVVHGLRRADMPANHGHTGWANTHGISSRNCTLVWSFRIQTNDLLEDDYGSSSREQSEPGLKDAL